MNVLKPQQNFDCVKFGLLFIHSSEFFYDVEKLTAWAKLCDKDNVILSLKSKFEINNERVTFDFLQNCQLIHQYMLFFPGNYFILFYNFHGIEFLVLFKPGKENLSEPSSPNAFDDIKGRKIYFFLRC